MPSNMIPWRVCEYDINSFHNLFLGVTMFDMIGGYDMNTTWNKLEFGVIVFMLKKKKNMFTLSNTLNNMSIHVDLQTLYTYKL